MCLVIIICEIRQILITFFFFLTCSYKREGGKFELVISTSLGVVSVD
jgi:hypothetical protein